MRKLTNQDHRVCDVLNTVSLFSIEVAKIPMHDSVNFPRVIRSSRFSKSRIWELKVLSIDHNQAKSSLQLSMNWCIYIAYQTSIFG